MIFVTVGTHEQPFDRLIKYIDDLSAEKIITEEVVMQTGFSTYIPVYSKWKEFFSYQEMVQYTAEARIIITHGGPSSFIMPLQIGKIPIVVPRQKKYGEHINNHQVDFVREVSKKQGNMIVIEDIKMVKQSILDYYDITADMSSIISSNNMLFNETIEELAFELVKRKQNNDEEANRTINQCYRAGI